MAGAVVSDLSLRREDATRSIHHKMARKLAARWIGDGRHRFDETVEYDDPSMRTAICYAMSAAWAVLAAVRYAAAMRRTLPRNTSVVFQLAFAALVTIWVWSMP